MRTKVHNLRTCTQRMFGKKKKAPPPLSLNGELSLSLSLARELSLFLGVPSISLGDEGRAFSLLAC